MHGLSAQGRHDGFVSFGRRNDFPLVAFIAQVVGAGVEHDVHEMFFAGLVPRDVDMALALEHPGHAAHLSEIAAVLRKAMADFADRAVAIIGGDFNQHGGAAGPIAFEHDFVDLPSLQLAGAAHDGLLDVIGGHADAFGGQDGGAQTGIGIRIAPIAGGDHNFLDDARKRFSALGVECGLLVLDGRPLRMT